MEIHYDTHVSKVCYVKAKTSLVHKQFFFCERRRVPRACLEDKIAAYAYGSTSCELNTEPSSLTARVSPASSKQIKHVILAFYYPLSGILDKLNIKKAGVTHDREENGSYISIS
jgi:hypothetical protein